MTIDPNSGGLPGDPRDPQVDEAVVAVAAKCPLFETLGMSEVRRVVALGHELRVPEGTQLAARGEHGEHIYIVLEGLLRVVSPITGELTWLLSAPEACGISAIVEPHRHIADTWAGTDCRLLAIPTMGLRALIEFDDSAGRRLLLEASRYLYRRMEELIEQATTHGGPDGLPPG